LRWPTGGLRSFAAFTETPLIRSRVFVKGERQSCALSSESPCSKIELGPPVAPVGVFASFNRKPRRCALPHDIRRRQSDRSGGISRTFLMARARSIAFSAATIAACLLCAWPVTIAPPAEADHLHMCCPMPSTTAYSIPRYSILAELVRAGFRSRSQIWCIRTTSDEAAGKPPEKRGAPFARGEHDWPGETSVGDAICDPAIGCVETLARLGLLIEYGRRPECGRA
jgi:hypothetical protein